MNVVKNRGRKVEGKNLLTGQTVSGSHILSLLIFFRSFSLGERDRVWLPFWHLILLKIKRGGTEKYLGFCVHLPVEAGKSLVIGMDTILTLVMRTQS